MLAEDDRSLAGVLKRGLTEQGYVVDHVERGDDALESLRMYEYAVAIVDWRMPGLAGDEVVRQARGHHVATPILMLTARDATDDKVEGLDAGADDYVVKPVNFNELLARLRAVQRRPREAAQPVLQVGDVKLDPAARAVTAGGGAVALTAREYQILEVLMRRSPAIVERSGLAIQVWSDESDAMGSNTIDVHIARLRRKLGEAAVRIVTVRGLGFRMVKA